MRAVRAAAAAAVLALLGLLVWDVSHSGHGGVAAKVDKGHTVQAPKTSLPFFGGRSGTFDLAAYRGKVVVLNFWASWCVDCKLEAKTLHDAAASVGLEGGLRRHRRQRPERRCEEVHEALRRQLLRRARHRRRTRRARGASPGSQRRSSSIRRVG